MLEKIDDRSGAEKTTSFARFPGFCKASFTKSPRLAIFKLSVPSELLASGPATGRLTVTCPLIVVVTGVPPPNQPRSSLRKFAML